MSLRTRQTGFTLIEIMIVVAIVAILAAIAYPAYTDQVRKARRADAKAALMELSQAAERYYTQNGTYIGYALAFTESPKESGTKFYDLAINPAATAQTFTITATPKAGQATDPCGTLTINQVGAKTATGGNADCWAR